ncbi:hypothetical protein KO519_16195 [Paraglaciecola agarilytica]|uniref:hypothetical protein n=1 Tax=Paraglaciecola chathamensis TaxID=368405 RepID=UPI001C08BF4E|nr:hypothetical protein [Paraglaciecola agarilytica]MBU3019222.1 hypothetical protein [Paraglaciecola agarilytica]
MAINFWQLVNILPLYGVSFNGFSFKARKYDDSERLSISHRRYQSPTLSVTDAISHRRYQSPTLSVTDDISHRQLISYHPIG